jgi:hypothetical protein
MYTHNINQGGFFMNKATNWSEPQKGSRQLSRITSLMTSAAMSLSLVAAAIPFTATAAPAAFVYSIEKDGQNSVTLANTQAHEVTVGLRIRGDIGTTAIQLAWNLTGPAGSAATLKSYTNKINGEDTVGTAKDLNRTAWDTWDSCYPMGGRSALAGSKFTWTTAEAGENALAEPDYDFLEWTIQVPAGSPAGTYTLAFADFDADFKLLVSNLNYERYTENGKVSFRPFTINLTGADGPLPSDTPVNPIPTTPQPAIPGLGLGIQNVSVPVGSLTADSRSPEGYAVVQVPLVITEASVPFAGLTIDFALDSRLKYGSGGSGQTMLRPIVQGPAFPSTGDGSQWTANFTTGNQRLVFATPGGANITPTVGAVVGTFNVFVPIAEGTYSFGFNPASPGAKNTEMQDIQVNYTPGTITITGGGEPTGSAFGLGITSVTKDVKDLVADDRSPDGYAVVQVPLTVTKSTAIAGFTVDFALDANLKYGSGGSGQTTLRAITQGPAFPSAGDGSQWTANFTGANQRLVFATPGGANVTPTVGAVVGTFNIFVPIAPGTYSFGFATNSPGGKDTDMKDVPIEYTAGSITVVGAVPTTPAPTTEATVPTTPVPTTEATVPTTTTPAPTTPTPVPTTATPEPSAAAPEQTEAVPIGPVTIEYRQFYWANEDGTFDINVTGNGTINVVAVKSVTGATVTPTTLYNGYLGSGANGLEYTVRVEYTNGSSIECLNINVFVALRGDVNLNKDVSAADAVLALKQATHAATGAGVSPLVISPTFQAFLSDVNNDGSIKAADAVNILKYAVARVVNPNYTWEQLNVPGFDANKAALTSKTGTFSVGSERKPTWAQEIDVQGQPVQTAQ